MEPDKFMSSDEFWPTLEDKKVIIWHRLILRVNGKKKCVVSGFVNQFEYKDKKAYMVLFELRSDVTIGSVSLERIINHVGIYALYLYRPDGIWQTRYVTKNITELGYHEEAFYTGDTSLKHILVKADYDILVGNLYKAMTTGSDDFEAKVRLVSADSSILSANLKCHLVKDHEGEIEGLEFLFVKAKDGVNEEKENQYIMSIMNKLKSFAFVQTIDDGHAKLKYITPNARHVGLNIDAVMQGNKLLEDYIHPEDRQYVIHDTEEAFRAGKSDFENEYRIVDDYGNVKWVRSQNSITNISGKTYTLECFLTDITDNKKLEDSVVEAKKEYEDKIAYIMKTNEPDKDLDGKKLLDREIWSDIVKAFSQLCGLYSSVIDVNGKQLVEPAGPQLHMGKFYDLFERPEYKDIYMKVNETILQTNVPVILEMDDGFPDSRICAAPIKIADTHVATWIACGYDKTDLENMERVYKIQWHLCSIFSEYAYNTKVLMKEARRSKSVEMILEEKIKRQKVLTEALNAMRSDSEENINTIMEQAGDCLGTDVVAIYKLDENMNYDCTNFWSKNNKMSAEEYIEDWQQGKKFFKQRQIKNFDCILVDTNHPNKNFQKAMEDGHVSSFVALCLEVNGMLYGCVILANTKTNKIWTEADVDFAVDIRNVIQSILTRIEGNGNIQTVNKLLIDTYNYLRVGIFIKDAENGEVLFANQALNNMLGYDFVGKDSKVLIRDLSDTFKGVGTVGKGFLTERKEVSWRSYIRQFDKIMDLSEVSMKWLDGRKASLVILRDVQD
jgi:PAS domain-containing protein